MTVSSSIFCFLNTVNLWFTKLEPLCYVFSGKNLFSQVFCKFDDCSKKRKLTKFGSRKILELSFLFRNWRQNSKFFDGFVLHFFIEEVTIFFKTLRFTNFFYKTTITFKFKSETFTINKSIHSLHTF